MVHAEFEDELVDMVGRDARTDFANQHVERLRGEAANAAHALEGFGIVNLDLSDIAVGSGNGFRVAHRSFPGYGL